MTTPEAPRWPLAPALRLAVLAMLFSVGAMMTTRYLSLALWAVAVVLVIMAGVKLYQNWSKRTMRR